MIRATFKTRPPRILDLDIENRPASYRGDFPTADITAIACSFVGDKEIECWTLGPFKHVEMLEAFRERWDDADMVTGHNIRRHDLPILNGAFIEFGLEPLDAKRSEDTLRDLRRTSGLPRDQESLCEMLGVAASKYHMTQHRWRVANRLQRVDLTERRVKSDVDDHKRLREVLHRRGLLHPPRWWRP